jgi:hypothetical protein
VNCTAIRCDAGITRLHKDYEQLKVGRSFLDPPRSTRRAGRLDAVYRPSERLRDLVDHVANVRHRRHKLVSAILAFQLCGPVLTSRLHAPPIRYSTFLLVGAP